MQRLTHRFIVFAGLALAVLAPAATLAGGGLQVSLQASRVSTDAKGQETFADAEHSKPGEVIEYRAIYRNPTGTNLKAVVATLPIPVGTEYLPRTASPSAVEASLDGKTYAPTPLKRRVTLADGREVLRDVPTTEYRYLRWSLGAIDARGEQAVRARVRVSPVPGHDATVH
jgi:uncharacterized repeat protein (TIGR01451 family)